MVLSFQSEATPTTRTSVTTIVRFVVSGLIFGVLTRFLVICVDLAAFSIVKYL